MRESGGIQANKSRWDHTELGYRKHTGSSDGGKETEKEEERGGQTNDKQPEVEQKRSVGGVRTLGVPADGAAVFFRVAWDGAQMEGQTVQTDG